MSVKVDLEKLADAMAEHPLAYLITVTDEERAHAVAVRPSLDGTVLRVGGLGNRTRANLAARPAVTLLFPPGAPGGYSLIVDGSATVVDESADVVPAHAVLHRPADHPTAPGDGSCGNDCVPVEA